MRVLILFFLLVGNAYAWNIQTNDCGVIAVGEGSVSCTTPTTGDELNEGFSSPTDLTWTDTGATITIGADLPGTGPSGTYDTCDVGARFQANNSSPWKYHDLGSGIARTNDVVITAIVYFDEVTVAGYSTNRIFSFNNSTTPGANILLELSFRYTSGTTYQIWAEGDGDSAYITLALDTYYKVTISLEGDHDGTSNIDIDSWNGSSWDAVNDDDFTRYDANDGRYVHIGPYSGIGSGETLDMYCGLLSIDTP